MGGLPIQICFSALLCSVVDAKCGLSTPAATYGIQYMLVVTTSVAVAATYTAAEDVAASVSESSSQSAILSVPRYTLVFMLIQCGYGLLLQPLQALVVFLLVVVFLWLTHSSVGLI
jgi:hypothetical protein